MTAKAVLSWALQELCWAIYTSVKPAGIKLTWLHVQLMPVGSTIIRLDPN